jgi:ferrous iron transport protein A
LFFKDVKVGKTYKIISYPYHTDRRYRSKCMTMGLIKGTVITVVRVAPLGDPIQLKVRGYELTLRVADFSDIIVHEIT